MVNAKNTKCIWRDRFDPGDEETIDTHVMAQWLPNDKLRFIMIGTKKITETDKFWGFSMAFWIAQLTLTQVSGKIFRRSPMPISSSVFDYGATSWANASRGHPDCGCSALQLLRRARQLRPLEVHSWSAS